MNYTEYSTVSTKSYIDYCNYLLEKYGAVDGDYFSANFTPNTSIKRRDENLFIHHMREDKVANLSNIDVARANDFEYQKARNLVYANLLEHILLHIMIGEQNYTLGFGGAELMISQANDYISDAEDYAIVLEMLKERLRNDLASCETLLQHNATVFYELDDTLSKHDRALVVIGTGLGKTTTALAYIRKYGMRGLVLGPNRVITDAWEKNDDVDTYTYQWFMTNYQTIDYSKYGVMICDEAHHCAAPKWGEGIRYALDNGLIKVMGLTATPKENKDKKNLETSRQFFQNHVCQGFTVLDGIEREIIHDFSYVGAIYDTTGIKETCGKCSDTALLGELDLALNNTPTVKEILTRHMPNNKRKGIIFVSNIEAIGEAIDIMKDIYPNVEYRAMHSLMSGNEIKENRKWFKDTDEGYLLAVNMISEGAHYKGVNTIIMFRRTQSSLVFHQQLGRIITLVRDEDPHAIVFDLVNNATNLDAEKSFSGSLREAYKQRKERGGKQKSEQIIVEDYAEKISEILSRIKENVSRFWSPKELAILTDYYNEHSHEAKINLTNLLPLLPRHTKSQIINQASVLGLTTNKRLAWTLEEDEILREYYPEMGSKIISLLPNRTVQSILQRANAFGLEYTATNKWTEEEKEIVCKFFPIEGIKGVQERLPNKPKKSIQSMACTLGIKMIDPNQNRRGQGHKKVRCVETGVIYESIAEASRLTGIGKPGICEACKYSAGLPSRQQRAGGYHWEYVD